MLWNNNCGEKGQSKEEKGGRESLFSCLESCIGVVELGLYREEDERDTPLYDALIQEGGFPAPNLPLTPTPKKDLLFLACVHNRSLPTKP